MGFSDMPEREEDEKLEAVENALNGVSEELEGLGSTFNVFRASALNILTTAF